MTTAANTTRSVATLGGGCFWCLDAVYRELRGVHDVVSGYAGGARPNPTYEQVCTGVSGHAEVVQVHYDPTEISYRDLLDIFFVIHDPTTRNRQGYDVGTQYRSVIFTHDAEQESIARAVVAALESQGLWSNPIVTEISPLPTVFRAEEAHQDYFAKHPTQGYCMGVVAPKVAKTRKLFWDKLQRVQT